MLIKMKKKKDPQLKIDEFDKIFSEYRMKIDAIMGKTEPEPDVAVDAKPEQSSDDAHIIRKAILSEIRKDRTDNDMEAEPPSDKEASNKEASRIIKDAELRAQKLLEEAEERIKKEAKAKTESEVEAILNSARKESDSIVSRARQEAEGERSRIIAESKREAEQLIRDVIERCRGEAQAQSSQIFAEAQERAEKMLADAAAASGEIRKTVFEVVNDTKSIMKEFEDRLHTECRALEKAFNEADRKFANFAPGADESGVAKAES